MLRIVRQQSIECSTQLVFAWLTPGRRLLQAGWGRKWCWGGVAGGTARTQALFTGRRPETTVAGVRFFEYADHMRSYS
jgi:hypothetical protein